MTTTQVPLHQIKEREVSHMKHPVPWRASHTMNWPAVVDAKGRYITSLLGVAAGDPLIRLFEASPELLDGLRAVLRYYEEGVIVTLDPQAAALLMHLQLLAKSIQYNVVQVPGAKLHE